MSLSGDGALRLWDINTGELAIEILTEVLGPWQSDIAFTQNGEAILLASSGCRQGECPVYRLTLSADQSLAGLLSYSVAQTFDLLTVQAVHSYSSPLGNGFVDGAAISPDGSLFLSGKGFGLHIWDNTTGQLIEVIDGMEPWGEIVFSADHRLLSIDGNYYGVISVWGVPAE